MKIKMLISQPKAGGGSYGAGEVHEFPDDVAARWIAQGKAERAEAVAERRPTTKKTVDKPSSTEE